MLIKRETKFKMLKLMQWDETKEMPNTCTTRITKLNWSVRRYRIYNEKTLCFFEHLKRVSEIIC